jgi:hypothetical protein
MMAFVFDLEKQGVTRVTVVTLFPDGDTALPSFFISPVREKNFPEQSALPSPLFPDRLPRLLGLLLWEKSGKIRYI